MQRLRRGEAGLRDDWKILWTALFCVLAAAVLVWFVWAQTGFEWQGLASLHQQKEKFRDWIRSFGSWGPVVFIGLQVFQVLFSPIPGELTGFLGGYVYGAAAASVFSTIGLTLGSLLAFWIGRRLGRPFVEKLIPPKVLEKFDFLIESRGALFAFIFFSIPGFPKDYMCYLLGLSPLRTSVFALVAFAGRIPGTIMLGVQGAGLYEERYGLVVGLLVVAVVAGAAAIYFQDSLLAWIRRKTGARLGLPEVEQKQGRGE